MKIKYSPDGIPLPLAAGQEEYLCSPRQIRRNEIGNPASRADYEALRALANRLCSRSPSASHLLALTSWMTLMTCLPSMTGPETIARIQGTVLSILFARASSMAPADQGLVKSRLGFGR